MRILQIILLAVLFGAAVEASAPPQTPAAQPARGSISGIVTSDQENRTPVRRAAVTIRGERNGETVVVTDAEGRFSAEGLGADRYTITASRPGFLVGSFGAKTAGAAGVPLSLADGERRNITLWMAKGGVISGRVIAPDGLPATGVSVTALAPAIADGQRVLLASATTPSAIVDDEGRFRIYGLRPQAYVVLVRPVAGTVRGLTIGAGVDDHLRVVSYAPMYFPGTADVGEARRVTIAAGEEVSGIDIPLSLVPAGAISGVVKIDGDSPLPLGTRLLLTRVTRGLAPYEAGETVNVDATGRFRVPPVAPGRYLLRLVNLTLTPSTAHLGEKPRVLWGRLEVDVDGKDLTDVVVQLHRGVELPGEVFAEAAPDAPQLDTSAVTISLQGIAVEGVRPANPASVKPDAAGKFTITGVSPGRYRVAVSFPAMSGRTLGWFLRSVSFNGAALIGDVLDVPEHARDGSLSLTFTTSPTKVEGRLILDQDVPASGYAVAVFPVNEIAWVMQSRNILNARPATDGAFSFTNLPAGEYYVCALTALAPADLGDPDFLRSLIPASVRVTVRDGQSTPLTLKIAR